MAKGKVTVFLGKFKDEDELKKYVKFTYDEEGEATSEFCRQSNVEWFDEDFMEAFMFRQEQPFTDIMMASYADTFKPSLQKQLPPALLNNFNSIILLYNCSHTQPVKNTEKLYLAGVFDYTTD
jgi:hypothetical protein